MYEDNAQRPRTSYLMLGVFVAFALYAVLGGEKSVSMVILALPITFAIGMGSFVICALLRPFIR